ncbi:hypothetical protein DCO47_03110 [Pseudomonas sp. NDM]|nr:hypothetical protein DCO47_03110 [Pseudomonas sp. NDM]
MALGGAQHLADGLVLLGPDDSRVRHGYLESFGVTFPDKSAQGPTFVGPDRYTERRLQGINHRRTLWERACSRSDRRLKQKCWLTIRLREQARSHTVCA